MTASISSAFSEDNISNVSFSTEDKLDILHITWVACVIGLITMVAVCGNILVMIAFSQDAKIQNTVSNLFILNMSISDFIVGLIIIPIHTCNMLLGYWPFGKIFCQLYISLDYSTSLVSILMVTLISLDRYWLVTKKLKYREFQTRRQVKAMIASCWLIVTGFYLTMAFIWEPIVGESVIDYTQECDLECLYNATFSSTMLFVEFIIPLIVIATLNTIVYNNISRRARGLPKQEIKSRLQNISSKTGGKPEQGSDSNITQTTSMSNISIVSLSQSTGSEQPIKNKVVSEKQEFIRHRKAAITLAVIVCVFVSCLIPYYICSIFIAFCEDCISDLVWEISNFILWCNASLNPFLYAVTIIHFRRKFYRLLGITNLMKTEAGTTSEISSVM